MRYGLSVALAASLAIHALALLMPQADVAHEADPPPLMAELRPAPMPAAVAAPPAAPWSSSAQPPRPQPVRRMSKPRQAQPRAASAEPVISVPAAESYALAAPSDAPSRAEAFDAAEDGAAPAAMSPEAEAAGRAVEAARPAAVAPRLPPRGLIRYRVDRGDANFAIGYAEHRWTIADGRYRLTSVAETTGLVWLFKSVRIEMESRGRLTDSGLQPQVFSVRRNGQPGRERADFDWDAMSVRVGERDALPLDEGAQDLLSFNYQLGYLADAGAVDRLPIATGKKYEVYRLEVIGDEELELPSGAMRTVHLRAPATNSRDSTELWLAYEYLLLPVKIRYLDAQGAAYVQVATRILVGDDEADDPVATEPATDVR
jgi:hypothetical protein